MLIGSTFAWFTDSVTSANNIIKSGNLDVVLEYWDGDSYEEVTSTTKLFNDAALWEPGYTEVAYLKVSNAGSLALKYQLAVNVYNEILGKTETGADIKLSDYLQFKVVESDTDLADTYTSREAAQAAPATATKLQTYSSDVKALENTGDTDYIALIIYMPTTVGNEANHNGVNVPAIEMGVSLFATQQTAESDSFNDQYDKDATLPSQSYVVVDGNDTEISVGDATVVVPEEAEDGAYTLRIENENKATNANDETVVSFDLSLEKDGVAVTAKNGVVYDVKYYAGSGLQIVKLLHKGEPVTNYEYNRTTGYVTFTVSDFSPFEIIYNQDSAGGYDAVCINTLEDFAAFGRAVNNNTTYNGILVANNPRVWVEVMADIDMTDAPGIQGGQFSIGNGNNLQFQGVFDGNGHTISNYTIIGSWTYNVSLFRTVAGNFTMKDITFDNCSATKPNNRISSILVGTIGGGTITFDNVDVKNSVSSGVAGAAIYAGKITEGALYFIDCDVDNATINASAASAANAAFLCDGYSHHDYAESGVWVENCTITNSTSVVNGVQDAIVTEYHYAK